MRFLNPIHSKPLLRTSGTFRCLRECADVDGAISVDDFESVLQWGKGKKKYGKINDLIEKLIIIELESLELKKLIEKLCYILI